MNIKDNKLTTDSGQTQAEPIMQTSMQLLPLILNNIPQAVFWKDRDLVYLGCNQAFADDAGFSSPKEVIGKTDYDMPWTDQAELYRADDRLVIEKGEPKLNYEEPQTTPSGTKSWLNTSKIPVYENGQVVAVLAMYEDITARKQAEEDLRTSEERFKRFTEATIEGLVFHEQGKIVDANPAVLTMFGLSDSKKLIGSNLLNFIAPESHNLVMQQMQLESVLPYEIQGIRQDGTTFPIETSTRAYRDGDRVIRASSIRDITERKQTETELRKSELRLSNAILIARMGYWDLDIDTQMFIFNDQYYRTFHATTTEEMGGNQMSVMDFIQRFVPPGEGDVIGNGMQEAIETKDPNFQVKLEAQNLTVQGELRWVSVWLTVEKDEHGRTVKLHGVNQDITERKRANEALHESEERFRRFTEATVEGLVFHEQGKIVDANPAALAMFGLSDEKEFVGKSLLKFLVPESHEMVLKQMQLETVSPYEVGCIRTDDSTFTAETSTRTYKIGEHTIRATSVRDITERKQAEADKLREKNIADATINSLPGIFYMFDAQGNLVRRNKNYETVAGYSAEEMTTRNALDAVAEEDRERVAQAIRRAFTEGKVELEVLFQTRHGKKIPYFMTAVRMAIGDDMYVVGTGLDLSERKQLEAQIQGAFERRGHQVQISTEISQEIASASELSDLFERVVTLTKERLGYYHTQLLRYDPGRDAVVLINGYGETGQKMLADGHQMPMGEGLIGTAASSGETVLRPALADDPDWQPNSLLPETKGEIAVPIKLGEQVLGVLDIQSDQAGALTEDDRLLLEGLCGQVAVAIEQTRLRQEMAERLEEINRLYQNLNHEGWKTYRNTTDLPTGFMYDQAGTQAGGRGSPGG